MLSLINCYNIWVTTMRPINYRIQSNNKMHEL